jgi:hypothetical protein
MSDPNQFQPPPPPGAPELVETMTVSETLRGMFFEPGRVFDSLRERPHFLAAGLNLVLLTAFINLALFQRVDMGQYLRDKMERSSRSAQQTKEQKEMGVKIGLIVWRSLPVFVPIWIAAGSALYLVGVLAFGGSMGYKRALAVWCYSALPPTYLAWIISTLVLILKSSETIDPEHLLLTNPGSLMDPESSKMLTALLTQFDILRFYGMFLAALGLSKVAKLSSSSAWAIVISLWLIGAILAIAGAAFNG